MTSRIALIVVVLLLLPLGVSGQFQTPTVDGTITEGEYGTHTSAINMYTNGSQNWYVTWNATHLFIGITGASTGEAAVVYLGANPPSVINSGLNANGTSVGFTYDETSFAELPFRANLVAYVKSDYREFRTSDGSGGWSAQTSGFETIAVSDQTREFSIPWSAVGGFPSSFAFFSYVTSPGGFVYAQAPLENLGGSIGTSARYPRYFIVSSTSDGSATAPFSRNSYVFNGTSDIGFESISVHDFTLNSAGRTITQNVGAVWNISGTLRVNDGTVNMGSNSTHMTTNHLEIGGSGSLALSTEAGGDLKVSGNVTLNGAFTHNDRAVYFIGGDQFLGKSVGDATLSIPHIIVDKDDNTDRVFLANTALRITRKVTLTRGRLDSNTGSVTFASDASHSASVDSSGTGSINLTFSVERHISRSTDPSGSLMLIGSPLPTPFTGSSAGLLSNVWTQGATGGNTTDGNPNVFSYSESGGLSGWTAVPNLTTSTDRGRGYLVGLFKDDVNGGAVDGGWPKSLTVSGTWQASENDGSEVSLPVGYTLGSGSNEDERGWNLVSNPFISTINWDAASGWTRTNIENWYQTLREDGTYQGYNHDTDAGFNSGSRFIAPFQGFWVKANAPDPALTVTDAVKVPDNQQAFNKSVETPGLWLHMTSESGHVVNTTLTLREDGLLGHDANDVPMIVHGTDFANRIATIGVESGSRLAMQHLPIAFDQIRIPVTVNVARQGTYAVGLETKRAIHEHWSLILECERTGNWYDLRKGETVTVGQTPGKETGFTLIIDPGTSTSTPDTGRSTPDAIALHGAYPNPFNPTTAIRFTLDAGRRTRLAVYDVLGREVAVLVDGTMSAGAHSVTFDASTLTSGVYIVRLEAGGMSMTRRVTLLK